MRSLAVWTTTAAVALLGVANAQTTAPADAGAASTGACRLRSPPTPYHSDVSELRANTVGDNNALEAALDRVSRTTRRTRTRLDRLWRQHSRQSPASCKASGRRRSLRPRRSDLGSDGRSILRTRSPRRTGSDSLLLNSARADSARIISVADRYQEMRIRCSASVGPTPSRQPAARIQRIRALGSKARPTTPCRRKSRRAYGGAAQPLALDRPVRLWRRRFWDACAAAIRSSRRLDASHLSCERHAR